MSSFTVGQAVTFSPRAGETAEGTITRVWDKPKDHPYVTIRTTEDTPRTFVRDSREVAGEYIVITPSPEMRAAILAAAGLDDELARP